MDELKPDSRQKEEIELCGLAAELHISPEDLSQMQVKETMRWAGLGIGIGWIFCNAVVSTLLFLLTKSPFAFASLTAATGITTSNLIKPIFRYLFWRPADYRLETLRLTLNAKTKEAKYHYLSQRLSRQTKN